VAKLVGEEQKHCRVYRESDEATLILAASRLPAKAASTGLRVMETIQGNSLHLVATILLSFFLTTLLAAQACPHSNTYEAAPIDEVLHARTADTDNDLDSPRGSHRGCQAFQHPARAQAHEIGHSLGLNHPSEKQAASGQNDIPASGACLPLLAVGYSGEAEQDSGPKVNSSRSEATLA
jgi:hypothetical protein